HDPARNLKLVVERGDYQGDENGVDQNGGVNGNGGNGGGNRNGGVNRNGNRNG
ncbi:hypothetical protein Tco_0362550, partial [Tanacetum coccineum]